MKSCNRRISSLLRRLIKLIVDTNDVDRFIRAMITTLPKALDDAADGALAAIATGIGNVIIEAIRTQMPNPQIGMFMAERTDVKVQPLPNGISIVIGGKPEGMMSNARPHNDPGTNLWEVHEFGGVSPATDKPIAFLGPNDGKMVFSPLGRKESVIRKHEGQVRIIIAGLAVQLEAAVNSAMAMAGAGAVVVTAKIGGVNLDMSQAVRAALGTRGVTESSLEGLGISKVFLRGNQVVYLKKNAGGTSTFFPAKSAGLPTRL